MMDRFRLPSRRVVQVQTPPPPPPTYDDDDDDADSDESLGLVEEPSLPRPKPSSVSSSPLPPPRSIRLKPPSSSSIPPPKVEPAKPLPSPSPPPSEEEEEEASSSPEKNNNSCVDVTTEDHSPEKNNKSCVDVTTEDQEPFMGMKVRRKASFHRDYKGDYLRVTSDASLMRILDKQGDRQVLFADKVLKFTESGKLKQRILLITDFAIYIVDPETSALKRRIALAAVDKLCLSELSDNFFAIIIPSEYDCLMASIRKSEIVTVLGQATESTSEYELQVVFSNRFEYHAAAEVVKEIRFEQIEGGVRTRIIRK